MSSGIIKQIKADHISYTFSSDVPFAEEEYEKFYTIPSLNRLLKGFDTIHNNQHKMIYLTESYLNFSDCVSFISGTVFTQICINIIKAFLDLRDKTAFSTRNLDLDEDSFYIDPETIQPYLIYIPKEKDENRTRHDINRRLRYVFMNLANYVQNKEDPVLVQFLAMLRSQASFPEIIEKMDLDIELDGIELHSSYLSLQRQTLILHPIKNECDDIIVDKDRFVLGRSKSRTDCPLSMSPSISNVHCRFTRNANLFFVEDMQSRNGTYINDNKLTPMLACAINDGDVLKLADVAFKVEIK